MDPRRTPTKQDRIRQFAVDHYVGPARGEGRAQVTIRAGDVWTRWGRPYVWLRRLRAPAGASADAGAGP
jgi:hypothetical protein